MSKYYAVKVGRVPGVYDTWDLCKKQVDGFPGAIHKSFKTKDEARQFWLGIAPGITMIEISDKDKIEDWVMTSQQKSEINKSHEDISFPILQKKIYFDNPYIVDIYTDGSHQRQKGYLGIGAYCQYLGKEYKLSSKCDSVMLAEYGVEETKCSNPTAELLGLAEVLKVFRDSKIDPKVMITFYIDYIGVKCWIEGSWKAHETYIIKIRDYCLNMMKQIGCSISIEHIPGHSGIHGNEEADKLAGDNIDHSNFDELIKIIEKL